jgi:hypothetical protein
VERTEILPEGALGVSGSYNGSETPENGTGAP